MKWVRAEGSTGKPTVYYDEKGPVLSVEGHRNRRDNNPGNIINGKFAREH